VKNDKLLNGLLIVFVLGGTICLGLVLVSFLKLNSRLGWFKNAECIKEVSGKPNIYLNYYDCNKISRGELVYYEYSKGLEPIVRKVWGLPGDKFNIISAGENRWNIEINGGKVKADNGDYWFEFKGLPPLKGYVDLGQVVLEEREYLLFSETSPGDKDSSSLGIVMRGNILGRYIPMGK
jgi:hypothetical protein